MPLTDELGGVGINASDDVEEPERYNEKCGIFGVYNVLKASHTCYYGMVGLQHRGQEGGGMVRCTTPAILLNCQMGTQKSTIT